MSDWNADPRSSFELADRIVRAGHGLKRTVGAGVGSAEATRILRAWLTQLDLGVSADGLLATLEQSDRAEPGRGPHPNMGAPGPRVAVVADDLASGRGLMNILTQLREREVPGHLIDVLWTDIEILSERRYDLVHVCGPGPAGIAAVLLARASDTPVVGSYHRDVLGLDGGDGAERLHAMLASFYGKCRAVLSPSRFADRSLAVFGVAPDRIVRWVPGVDRTRFSPACYGSEALPDAFNVLYAGRLASNKGLDLLVDAFQVARDRDPRLHLVLAGDGDGPLRERLGSRLGAAATFLGWLDATRLAGVYASADLLVLPSSTDTTGQVVLEAQASGLPVLAVDASGASELIESGRSGCLVAAEPAALGSAIRGLARRATLQDRLATGGLMAVRERTWERSLAQLASGYARARGETDAPHEVARAA